MDECVYVPKFKVGQIVSVVGSDLVGVVTRVLSPDNYWYINYGKEDDDSGLYEVKFGKEFIRGKSNSVVLFGDNELELHTKPKLQLENSTTLESWLSSPAERSLKTDKQILRQKTKLNSMRNTMRVRMDGR